MTQDDTVAELAPVAPHLLATAGAAPAAVAIAVQEAPLRRLRSSRRRIRTTSSRRGARVAGERVEQRGPCPMPAMPCTNSNELAALLARRAQGGLLRGPADDPADVPPSPISRMADSLRNLPSRISWRMSRAHGR